MIFPTIGHKDLLLLLLLLAIFILDWLTPVGYAVWIFYVIPIILASRVSSPQIVKLAAAASSGLIVIAHVLSTSSPISSAMVAVNTTIGVLVIWTTVKILLENKQAEGLLRDSEERFRLLVEQVKDYAIILLDPEGRVATWNIGAERIKQYEAAEIVGESMMRFYLPEDQAAGLPDQLLDLARRNGRVENKGWQVRKDGSPFMANLVLTALRDETGRLKGFAKVTRDITERNQEAERLGITFEAIPSGLLVADGTGCIVQTNVCLEHMFGYIRDELIGQPVERLIPERYRGAHLSQRAGFFHSPSPRPMGSGRDLYGLRKDGTEFPVEIGLNPIKTNAGISVLCTIIDITQRKQEEEVNRESTARKEFALETGQLGEWDLDLISHIATRSLRHDQIFGYQSLLPEWTYEMFLGHVVPEDRDRVDRTFQQAVEAHRRWDLECRIIRVDKEVRWIRAQGRPRHDACSQSMRITGIVQDITEQKQAEDALHRQEVLRQVFEERESLARNLHDGILQSLYAVRLGLEGCRRSLVKDPQHAIPEMDARIKDVGLVIAEVRDFMTGQDPAWVRTSDLRKGIEELLQANRAEDRPVWRLHAPEQGGADGLSSVEIKHLLYMAHEAMSNVARHSSAESCDVTLASNDDRLRLTIEDNGVGFAAGTARGSGQGLGYMEARARQIGATFDIASAPGRGTRITVEIINRKTHVSS